MAGACLLAAASCSGPHRPGRAGATGPPATTLPPGTITTDVWNPPVLSGPPSAANFCAALTALYGHMAELQHVLSSDLAARFLEDYVAYQPTLVAEAPPDVRSSVQVYTGAVATYLAQLASRHLDQSRLPPGSLAPLASAPVNAAYTALTGYSTSTCHYTIGGQTSG